MTNFTGKKSRLAGLETLGLSHTGHQYWNLSPAELVEHSLCRKEGTLDENGALCVDTGEFTGRSPKDKFIVEDELSRSQIWWGEVNQPISPQHYEGLLAKVKAYLQENKLYIRDMYAGADEQHRISVRVVNEAPWPNLFVGNMFIQPEAKALENFVPEWTVLAMPGLRAEGEADGVRQHNFSVINFSEKMILIGGSGYTGEIKKGIFTVLNYLLPQEDVLPMHCSANMGKQGDTAVFFGLSGTGKTTLSADPNRNLIGDDEHGWTAEGVFNFEGGCYAKCIDLSPEKEPQIWKAIKHGALVENTRFFEGSRKIDFSDTTVTENTRVSYPIDHIEGALLPSRGGIPHNIFFLTCDAFGVLPPISRLSAGQAMFQFISGYTAKVAGTEEGIVEPQVTFSACFGAPFLPLHPTRYAEMLGEKIRRYGTRVWLVNTGWTGGSFGDGSRINLKYTRAMISAALEAKLEDVEYATDPFFGLRYPLEAPGVPSELLNPRNTWRDKQAYDRKAQELAESFNREFQVYQGFASREILDAAPKVLIQS